VVSQHSNVSPHLALAVHRFTVKGLDLSLAQQVLASLTGDGPEEFENAWFSAARTWEDRADAAVAEGRLISAREWYRQAYYCHRLVVFSSTKADGVAVPAYQHVKSVFRKWVAISDERIEECSVAFEDVSVPGYLVLPERVSTPVPAVVFIYGADGLKEEQVWQSAMPLAKRGIAVLVADGPGQGSSLRDAGLAARADYEVYGSAAFDVLAAHPLIDANRIGIYGSSMGGYYAPRVAAVDERFEVCVVNSACYSVVDGVWDYYPPLRPQFMFNVGTDDEAAAKALYKDFSLAEVAGSAKVPIHIFHGEDDALIPVSQARQLYQEWGAPKELSVWPGGSHNLFSHALEAHNLIWDTTAAALHGPTRVRG
jgi:alpha-beta hydrolase superfamily lysophospholipase